MGEMNFEIAKSLNRTMDLDLPENISEQELREKIKIYINHLINTDFQKLISILYRVDVDEKKLKKLLQENTHKDASEIIANLMIERQAEKLKTRGNTNPPDENIPEDEKW